MEGCSVESQGGEVGGHNESRFYPREGGDLHSREEQLALERSGSESDNACFDFISHYSEHTPVVEVAHPDHNLGILEPGSHLHHRASTLHRRRPPMDGRGQGVAAGGGEGRVPKAGPALEVSRAAAGVRLVLVLGLARYSA